MAYLGVDLAARFSAAVLLDEGGKVVDQLDSWGMTALDFVGGCELMVRQNQPTVTFFEDLPYGLSNQKQIKPPIRVQGYAIAEFHRAGFTEDTYFLAPATWKRHFDLPMRGQTEKQKAESAAAKALEFGYTPPNLLELYADDVPPLGTEHAKLRSSIRGKLKKASTDYVDAFLIARYLLEITENGSDFSKIQGLADANP